MRALHLEVIKGPCRGVTGTFDRTPVFVGRGDNVHFALALDATVSRLHASVKVDEAERIFIEDLGGGAGTFATGMRVQGVREIAPGTSVKFGASTVRVGFAPSRGAGATKTSRGKGTWVTALAIAAVSVICLLLLWRGWSDGGDENGKVPNPPPMVDLSSARDLRNEGKLDDAIASLRGVAGGEGDGVALLVECQRLKAAFDKADRLEAAVQWWAARDQWRLILETLTSSDPLRTQVERRIEALDQKIKAHGG